MTTREKLTEIDDHMAELHGERTRLRGLLKDQLFGEANALEREHRAAGTDPMLDPTYCRLMNEAGTIAAEQMATMNGHAVLPEVFRGAATGAAV